MKELVRSVAGLRTVVIEGDAPPPLAVVVLHGYAMRPEDLAPFAHSLGVSGRFYFAEGPVEAAPRGRAWWPIDQERRAAALARGPRDLHEEAPAGATAARTALVALLSAVRDENPGSPVALVGFSQGGMLACDTLLREEARVEALALLSSSRISASAWESRIERLAGLPVLVAHGRGDDDLGFFAGEALRDLMQRAGARVTWVPFDGGHEIPLAVWRALRALLKPLG